MREALLAAEYTDEPTSSGYITPVTARWAQLALLIMISQVNPTYPYLKSLCSPIELGFPCLTSPNLCWNPLDLVKLCKWLCKWLILYIQFLSTSFTNEIVTTLDLVFFWSNKKPEHTDLHLPSTIKGIERAQTSTRSSSWISWHVFNFQ